MERGGGGVREATKRQKGRLKSREGETQGHENVYLQEFFNPKNIFKGVSRMQLGYLRIQSCSQMT